MPEWNIPIELVLSTLFIALSVIISGIMVLHEPDTELPTICKQCTKFDCNGCEFNKLF